MCLSIFLASRYRRNNLRRTRRRRIQRSCAGIRAFLAPFLEPVPAWRPLRWAACHAFAREREWIWTCLRITRPSFANLRMFLRELARATSLVSLGSIQTLFLPHFSTEDASLFYSLKNAIIY